jgi:hypothetical protein
MRRWLDVTMAAVASANTNAANANAAAAKANANAAAGQPRLTTPDTTPAQPRVRQLQQPPIPSGQLVGALPAGCITSTAEAATYYLCRNTWFSAAYGGNGVDYGVVTAP